MKNKQTTKHGGLLVPTKEGRKVATEHLGAAIAQWRIRLGLPSCHPGFESQTVYACINLNLNLNCDVEKMKKNRKRGRDWPIFLKKTEHCGEKLSL